MYKALGGVMILASLFMTANAAFAQAKERAEIAVEDTWRLEDIYPSDEAWNQAKTSLVAKFDDILQFKGKVAATADNLYACLSTDSGISMEFGKLARYASMRSDQDTRVSKYNSMLQEIRQLGTDYNSKASFIEPELVKLDKATIDQYISQEAGIKDYKFYLYDLQRIKEHKLSEKEEKILAEAGLLTGNPASIYRIFTNAELPYPEIVLSDGEKALLNQAGYSRYRAATNRQDREKVFQEFWTAYNGFRQTIGEQLYSNVKSDMFAARTRGYESCLQSALDADNITVEVYHSLVKNVNDNLDSFHRYLSLRKRMLGVDTLRYSDMYAPVVKGVDLKYTIEEAKALVIDTIKPLGKEYSAAVKQGFENRWIDVYPNIGKRSGAYMSGVYGVHPYMLLNFNEKYDDMSTLAHELGHAMHSYFSNKVQPYPTAGYSIFVAEVASTLNEALLIDKTLKEIKDDDVRLSLLMSYLDGLKGTVFRQTQFAEFELRIHEKAEKGEPLTGDNLTELYGEILKKYYGHDKGICQIDDLVQVEWAYIPHFYYNFYVYQYATSFTASTALAERIINKEKGAVDNVLAFLSAGGSDYPIEILKKAGVDMTTADPFTKTMQAMNRTMDEIDKILEKKGI